MRIKIGNIHKTHSVFTQSKNRPEGETGANAYLFLKSTTSSPPFKRKLGISIPPLYRENPLALAVGLGEP